MKRILQLTTFLAVLLSAQPLLAKAPFDHLTFAFQGNALKFKWKRAFHKETPTSGVVEFIPSRQTLKNWNQMLTLEFDSYQNHSKPVPSITQIINKRVQGLTQRCRTVSPKLLHQNKKQLVYWWTLQQCEGSQDQSDMMRLIQGRHGFNWIRYSVKTSRPSPSQYEAMLKTIMSAKLAPAQPKKAALVTPTKRKKMK